MMNLTVTQNIKNDSVTQRYRSLEQELGVNNAFAKQVTMSQIKSMDRSFGKIVSKMLFRDRAKIFWLSIFFPSRAKNLQITNKSLRIFLAKLSHSNIALNIPRALAIHLSRSQLKLLRILIQKKQEELDFFHNLMNRDNAKARAENGIRNGNYRMSDIEKVPGLENQIQIKIDDYRRDAINAKEFAQSKWVDREINRFRMEMTDCKSISKQLYDTM